MTERSHLPEWLVERVALDEVPRSKKAKAAEQARTPEAAAQLAALHHSNEEILALLPPERIAAEVHRRLSTPAPVRRRTRWMVSALVPAVAVALIAVLIPRAVQPPPAERVKGLHPQLVAYRRQGERVERLEAKAIARAGDVLQLGYVAAQARQGVVLSLDGAGQVTLHWPREQSLSAPLQPSAEVTLPNAYRLDQAPGFERFFFVTSDRPFAIETVIASVRALAASASREEDPLRLPEGLQQTSLLLEKRP